MLLAIDISNTNIKFGLYNSEMMRNHWVVSTARQRTTDEYAMVLNDLTRHAGYSLTDIEAIILSSVVPPLTPVFQELATRYCGKEAIVLDHSLDLGIRLLVDNPWEIGSDRIATSIAAHSLYGGPAIIIAFSTATTFDVISSEGDFLGGAIAPGLVISAEALSSAASRLYRVDMTPPRVALGKNTIENMQSGIIFGHVGLVQGLIARLRREIPGITGEEEANQIKIIAHGGLAPLMAPIIPEIQFVNQFLPLEGLRLAYVRIHGWRRGDSNP
jgi:type III pantothenate kinase